MSENAENKRDKVQEEITKAANTYPAIFLVDWPTGPVYVCNNHAARLITLGRTLGHNVGLQGCGPGHACVNCIYEAKKKEGKDDAAK